MGVTETRELRAEWIGNDGLQASLEFAFNHIGFDQTYVESCLKSAQVGSAPRKTKHIKDNVWGMVEIDWRTVRLLDSPVLQRLRGIKQLGL